MSKKETSDFAVNSCKRKERQRPHKTIPSTSEGLQTLPSATTSVNLRTLAVQYFSSDRNKLKSQNEPKLAKNNAPAQRTHRATCQISTDLTKKIHNFNFNDDKMEKDFDKSLGDSLVNLNEKIPPAATLDKTQALQIKKILAECLQNLDESSSSSSIIKKESSFPLKLRTDHVRKHERISVGAGTGHKSLLSMSSPSDPLNGPTLLRSYLLESIPRREEYISKKKNVSNSLISSDSIHHSIYLESGRERRQCLLQYLSNVATDGQVVIYVNSIPGVESLLDFLTKHGFKANAVHPRMLMAQSNWILSEFSLQRFKILLCAEDHYHSCPAHFRWIKTIINYDLPISSPMENWVIRNGIVDFSDNLPVHIYTFIKKTCPLDNELVKLLQLNSGDQDEEITGLKPHSAQ